MNCQQKIKLSKEFLKTSCWFSLYTIQFQSHGNDNFWTRWQDLSPVKQGRGSQARERPAHKDIKQESWLHRVNNSHQPAIRQNRDKLQQECAQERICLTRERLPPQEPNTTDSPRRKPVKCQMMIVLVWKLFLRKQNYFSESEKSMDS